MKNNFNSFSSLNKLCTALVVFVSFSFLQKADAQCDCSGISYTVTDPPGYGCDGVLTVNDASGTMIFIFGNINSPTGSQFTSPFNNGVCTTTFPFTNYTISFLPHCSWSESCGGWTFQFNLPAPNPSATVSMESQPSFFGCADGAIRFERTDQDCANAAVGIFRELPGGGYQSIGSATVPADEVYVFNGLLAGNYKLVMTEGSVTVEYFTTVTQPGCTGNITTTKTDPTSYGCATGTITATRTDSDCNPITVEITKLIPGGSQSIANFTMTGGAGPTTITDLYAGEYFLEYWEIFDGMPYCIHNETIDLTQYCNPLLVTTSHTNLIDCNNRLVRS